MKIAVDLMGGDYAPEEILLGIKNFLLEDVDTFICAVGQEEVVNPIISRFGLDSHERFKLFHASEAIVMSDSPTKVIRSRKDNSIGVAVSLVSEGKADALVSAGNTGAVTACAIYDFRCISGIKRPAIGTFLPQIKKGEQCLMLDAGATVDCSAENLQQFALMGNIYAQKVMGIKNPRIALLNIGEENTKGNILYKEAYKLLESSKLNFVGNLEPYHFFSSLADVIVCCGFSGNIVLKCGEGAAKCLVSAMKQEIKESFKAKLGSLLMKKVFTRMSSRYNHSQYGGAPLLGLNYPCIIAHGNSKAFSIKNAIRVARINAQSMIANEIKECLLNTEKLAKS